MRSVKLAHTALSLIARGSTTAEGVAWLSSKSEESGVVATGSGLLYANPQIYNLVSVLNTIPRAGTGLCERGRLELQGPA